MVTIELEQGKLKSLMFENNGTMVLKKCNKSNLQNKNFLNHLLWKYAKLE